MRGRPRLGIRTERPEETQQAAAGQADLGARAEQLAAELGTTADELLAEAVELGRRRCTAGAVTLRQLAALVAAEVGCTPGDGVEEVERLAAGARG